MDTTRRDLIMQRWNVVQHDLLPELRTDVGKLTPKLEKVIYILEWVRIEELVHSSWSGEGRPPHERSWLSNAFVAKSVLGMTTTRGLIERQMIDRALRRICGFPRCKKLPSEATFSRAFDEFAAGRLAERVHEALIKEHLGSELIGHISRDGTAIEAREHPVRPEMPDTTAQPAPIPAEAPAVGTSATETPAPAKKRGRHRKDAVRPPAKESPIHRQRQQPLAQISKTSPRPAIEAPSAMPKATRSVGTATNCIWTPPTVACRSRRCCLPRRCTIAWPPFPCR